MTALQASQSDLSNSSFNDEESYGEISPLPGESVLGQVNHVIMTDVLCDRHLGTIMLTDYRLVFFTDPESVPANILNSTNFGGQKGNNSRSTFYQQGPKSDDSVEPTTRLRSIAISKVFVSIPLFSIKSVISSRPSAFLSSNNAPTYGVQVISKDFRKLELRATGDTNDLRRLVEKLEQHINYSFQDPTHCFAYRHVAHMSKEPNWNSACLRESWSIYDPREEFRRQNIESNGWRLIDVNKEFLLCSSYPELLAVPKNVSSEDLRGCADFRASCRIPVLSWLHPESRAALCRCSQPTPGLQGSRNSADESYVHTILQANANENVLYIFDARPLVNAQVNRTLGGGIENTAHYEGTRYVYLKIENIHAIRTSWTRLEACCTSSQACAGLPVASNSITPYQDDLAGSGGAQGGSTNQGGGMAMTYTNTSSINDNKWFESIGKTLWLQHIRRIIYGAICVVEKIENKTSVLVHCSDGWDRTPQVTSLAMLLLDPYYRTLRGFEVLIEKEWCSMGHQFPIRLGLPWCQDGNQISPIFQQFLDCVWQVQQQFRHAFEFNERFLIEILEHLTSCRFGNFLFSTEQARQQNQVYQKTFSLWSYINSNEMRYKNPFYIPEETTGHRVLLPQCASPYLKIWTSCYMRMNPLVKPSDLPTHNAKLLIQQRERFLQLMRSSRKDTTLVPA